MKKFFMLLLVTLFLCAPTPAHAGETIVYSNYGGCELITRHVSHWLAGSGTFYGLAKGGREILPPCCEMWYDEALRIFVFRMDLNPVNHKYRLFMYSAENGKQLYQGDYFAASNGDCEPYITFENRGKYRNAVVNYFIDHRHRNNKKVVGNFFRQNGKLYQVQERQVKVDAPVE